MANATTSPFAGSITCGSSSATPGSRPTSTATPSASTWSPTPASRRASKHEAGYVLKQGNITFVLVSPLSTPASGEPTARQARRRRAWTSPSKWTTCRKRIARRPSAAGVGVTPPTLLEDEHGVYEFATIRTYGDTTHTFVNRDRYRGVFAPGYKPIDPDRYNPATAPAGRPESHRSRRRQRRRRQDGRVGQVLQERARLRAARPLRRQGHQHRVLGADVEGRAERQRADQVPDQRAGRGQSGDRRSRSICSSTAVPACSTSPWRPATSSKPSGAMRAQ